jgi:hypothetical protein
MQLGLTRDHQVGWLFGDEAAEAEHQQDSYQSFSYVVAWGPATSFERAEYSLPGERKGEYYDFRFRFDGHLFLHSYEGRVIRLAIHDPMSPQDFRGLPFLRAFPYVGRHYDVLESYDKSDFPAFLPLIPLDLIAMDELYLREKVVFVGVTPEFGPHKFVGGQRR